MSFFFKLQGSVLELKRCQGDFLLHDVSGWISSGAEMGGGGKEGEVTAQVSWSLPLLVALLLW